MNRSRTQGWRDFALCLQVSSTTLFYPAKGESVREAKQVCSMCRVKALCLAEAMATPEKDDHGIWGATSAFERRGMRRAANRKATVTPLPVVAHREAA